MTQIAGTTAGLDWASLRRLVVGQLITPADPSWSSACTPWMVHVIQHPAAVLEVACVEDVVAAVRWAVDHGLAVSAQPVGHSPRPALDGSLLLRTRALDGIEIDLMARTARVGAGVTWRELLARLDGTGLVGLAGSSPDLTVVGLTLGGGLSWFSRAYGLAANSVRSLDVVDAFGRLVRVTADSDHDLFWALRGGGGDFGVVVAIEIELHAGPALYGGRLQWPVEHAPAVLRAFRDVAGYAPREFSILAQITHHSSALDVPASLRGRSMVSVAVTYLGEMITAEALLWPIREAAAVEIDTLGELPISRLGEIADEPTGPLAVVEHGMLLDGLDDASIDRLVAAAGDVDRCPLALLQLRGLGGAIAETWPWHGAAGPVAAPFLLYALGAPTGPQLEPAMHAAFTQLDAAMVDQRLPRRLPNFTGTHQSDAAGYDAATLERLRAIKRERDPAGTIRSNKPVLGN